MEFLVQLQTNERENSATLTTSDGELRLFAYDCPDVSTIILIVLYMYFIFYLQALQRKPSNSKTIMNTTILLVKERNNRVTKSLLAAEYNLMSSLLFIIRNIYIYMIQCRAFENSSLYIFIYLFFSIFVNYKHKSIVKCLDNYLETINVYLPLNSSYQTNHSSSIEHESFELSASDISKCKILSEIKYYI